MSLLDLCRQDCNTILADPEFSAAQDLTLTDPAGEEYDVRGFVKDTGLKIDPETGLEVTTRQIGFSVPEGQFSMSGHPQGVVDSSLTPWLMTYAGTAYKVTRVHPDRTIGYLDIDVEAYDN